MDKDQLDYLLTKIQVNFEYRKPPLRLNAHSDILISLYHEDTTGIADVILKKFPTQIKEVLFKRTSNPYVNWHIWCITK